MVATATGSSHHKPGYQTKTKNDSEKSNMDVSTGNTPHDTVFDGFGNRNTQKWGLHNERTGICFVVLG